MLMRVAVNIMQNIAPAFMVVCVLLCLSFSYTLPLHRSHPNDLAEPSNRSQKCGSANRPKKTPSTEVQDLKDFFSEDDRQYAEAAKRKLSGDDLRQYEQLVIMKKYPYLDLKEFELKYGPSAVNNVKYVRDAEIAEGGENGECKLTDDDGPHVEIFSRGISGFAIPKRPSNAALKSAEDARRVETKLDDVKLRGQSRGWASVNDLPGNDLY